MWSWRPLTTIACNWGTIWKLVPRTERSGEPLSLSLMPAGTRVVSKLHYETIKRMFFNFHYSFQTETWTFFPPTYRQQHTPLGQWVLQHLQSSHHQETMLPWLHLQAVQMLLLKKRCRFVRGTFHMSKNSIKGCVLGRRTSQDDFVHLVQTSKGKFFL